MTDTDYTDGQQLFANLHELEESQLLSLEKIAWFISLYMNANKVEDMRVK